MISEDALALLRAEADPVRAEAAAAHHKAPRAYLGLSAPQIEARVAEWRAGLDVPGRVALADALWQSDVHEARIAAAKVLTQARIRDDAAVWALILSWVPQFDAWAIADAAAAAGARRLMADPARLGALSDWVVAPNRWTRRAVLTFTQGFSRLPHPKAADLAAREQVLGWAADLAAVPDALLQRAVAGWLRDLSRHDAPRVRDWLAQHGQLLTRLAFKEAAALLPDARPAAGDQSA
ncbi:DNA alkylation repair protein [Rhodobacter veldkampii DSM 11550]|uniref:DNA alkylation repair protein n=1 Tax=Phaeovulum veldkampii DSM 11550 TaxID=1185920 RepID=A0A2T4JFK6_9RHOB|nr:DNA alkylation repair protein [Phaeovulum veldkampii]MBK5945308.1 DNA alkylation repair protein [Phaeovulum veldkampii DSM 11550]PTE16705.1 DNA alkylation repair protein [Phaeovulum veldkampii DSM 11550]TDQ60302.1 3-methyladenine DNA glycosylase AlkD [Phaeovulum veldkampii DSM 11550]